jgi:hypothetical protein
MSTSTLFSIECIKFNLSYIYIYRWRFIQKKPRARGRKRGRREVTTDCIFERPCMAKKEKRRDGRCDLVAFAPFSFVPAPF